MLLFMLINIGFSVGLPGKAIENNNFQFSITPIAAYIFALITEMRMSPATTRSSGAKAVSKLSL